MQEKELIAAARKAPSSPEVVADLRSRFTAEQLADGSAAVTHLGDFLWAIESPSEPHLYVDDKPAPRMKVADGSLRIHVQRLFTGYAHAHYYRVDGKILGDRRFDNAALTADSYPQPGVPEGKVSEAMVHESGVYRGHAVSWWIYAAPGVDPSTPAPVMVWHDGHRFLRHTRSRLFPVTENLVAQKKIPPMLHVLISPGVVEDPVNGPYTPPSGRRLRSVMYDAVNDDYNHMVFGEIFPKVDAMYKARRDGYSIGTCGQSSGGVCAFNMAWQRPEQVSRVISRIGTFTSIQWRRGQPNAEGRYGFDDPAGFLDGGNIFPFLIRKSPRKNIRAWLSDGAHDLENTHGSWPLQNIQMANSLKMADYDFHFRFGNSQHNTEQGDAELPEAMTWLWRGYDPERVEALYEPDPAEKDKPYFRVGLVNR